MKLEKIIYWLLPWYYISFMYVVGNVPIGLIIYTPLLLVLVIKKKHLVVDPPLRLLFFVLITVSLLQMVLPYTDATTIFHTLITTTIHMLSIICVVNYVKLKDVLWPYIIAALIFICGLFYQVFQLFIWHVPITGPILIFPGLISEQNVVNYEIFRPMSFFQEPQAFATWMIVFIIVMIEEKRLFLAILGTISVLLSTSTEGLLLLVAVWGLYLLFYKTSTWTKVLVLAGLLFLYTQYTSLEIFSVGLDKVTGTDYGESKRLTQGFYLLRRMGLGGWLLGMGTAWNSFYSDFAGSIGLDLDDLYFSSATGVFIQFGFFVGICYWINIITKINTRYKCVFIYSIILCIIPFAQTSFFSPDFVYLFAVYFLLLDHCKQKESLLMLNK